VRSAINKGHKYTLLKLTLEKYKAVDAIINDESLSEIDKTLYCICAVYNYAPEELDKEDPKKVIKMAAKIEKVFKFKITAPAIIGIYKINYDISSITFGQYIELSYFFQFNAIDKANYIIASVAKTFIKRSHSKIAEYFSNKHIGIISGAMAKIRAGYVALNKEFGALFGLDEEVHPEANKDSFMSNFNKRYGWIYSAEAIALYERISVEDAYKLPVKRALNDLVYLKAKQKYEYLLTQK
jgi:hypothetical protein